MRAQPNSNYGSSGTSPLGCSASGCTLKWTNDYGRRLCSEHDRILRFGDAHAPMQRPIPETLKPAARPYSEPQEREDDDADAVPF